MAIKSNSRKAIDNIRQYVIDRYDAENYDEASPEYNATTFEEMAACILKDVKRVKEIEFKRVRCYTWQDAFADWASGLPSLLDTCYYYNRSAVDDLAVILEETEAEKSRYDETKAERMLSNLIFRELYKVAGYVL